MDAVLTVNSGIFQLAQLEIAEHAGDQHQQVTKLVMARFRWQAREGSWVTAGSLFRDQADSLAVAERMDARRHDPIARLHAFEDGHAQRGDRSGRHHPALTV
jgi:hypothetical protein